MKAIRLSEAIAQYEAHLRAKGKAPNTIRNYTQILKKGLKQWGNINTESIRPSHVDQVFAAYNFHPSTQNLYLGNLRQFFKWCRSHRYMSLTADPTETWGNVRVPKNYDKTRIPVEMFPEILDACVHPRDRALVAIGMYTLLRGSEITTLKIHDLDLDAGTLEVVRHKTKDYDTMPVSEELHEEMVRWLNWYRQDQGFLQGDFYLTPAKQPDIWDHVDGKLVKSRKLSHLRPYKEYGKPYLAVQRALKAMGLDDYREGVHTLRRSSARAYADLLRGEGYDGALLRVASMLGHSSTKITEHYIGWGLERSQRNAMIAGKPMFPGLKGQGEVIDLGGKRGNSEAV